MIKKVLFLFLIGITFLEGKVDFKTRSEVAILINADTGAVLYEKNSKLSCYPASITKVATAVYASYLLKNWEEMVEVPSEAIGSITYEGKKRSNYKKPAYSIEVGSTHIGLKKGENLLFSNLMGAMITASANDAANVIAYHLGGGDIDSFVSGMNKYLKEELGCKKTTFRNPHGLFIPDHQTTAKDMAIIARAFLKDNRLKELGSTYSLSIDKTNKQEVRNLISKNKLLSKGSFFYSKAIGIKTGYTSDARHTLVAAAEDKGRCLIAVLMKCEEKEDLFKDAKEIFEAAFSEEKSSQLLFKKTSRSLKKNSKKVA